MKYIDEKKIAHLGFTFDYGFDVYRVYHMKIEDLIKLKTLKKLYESRDFKERYKIINTDAIKKGKYAWKEIYFNNKKVNIEYPEKLIKKMDLDLQERAYEDEIDKHNNIFDIKFIKYKDSTIEMKIPLRKTDKHTLKWFKENGYEKFIK